MTVTNLTEAQKDFNILATDITSKRLTVDQWEEFFAYVQHAEDLRMSLEVLGKMTMFNYKQWKGRNS